MKYCPNCKTEAQTHWKFGMERCVYCGSGFGKPIYRYFQEIPNRRERNRRVVEQMVASGEIFKEDLK